MAFQQSRTGLFVKSREFRSLAVQPNRHETNQKRTLNAVFAAIAFSAYHAFAQELPISTDGTDPNTWDPRQDAVIAGVKNNTIIFEDSEIRVLSVTVEPGEVEVPHHQWPRIIVYDMPVKSENRDGKRNLLPPKRPAGDKVELPRVIRLPSEALHSVANLDKVPLHLIRVEFKNGFPKQ